MKNEMCMKNMISITVHFSVSLIFPRFRLSAKLPLRGALTWTWDTDSWQCVLLIKINFRVNLQVSFPFYTAAYSQCMYQDFHFHKATFQQRQGRSRSFCELSSLQQEEVFYILGCFIFSSLQVFWFSPFSFQFSFFSFVFCFVLQEKPLSQFLLIIYPWTRWKSAKITVTLFLLLQSGYVGDCCNEYIC